MKEDATMKTNRVLCLLLALCACFSVTAFAAAKPALPPTAHLQLADVPAAFDKLGAAGQAYAKPSSKAVPKEMSIANQNHNEGIAIYGQYILLGVQYNDKRWAAVEADPEYQKMAKSRPKFALRGLPATDDFGLPDRTPKPAGYKKNWSSKEWDDFYATEKGKKWKAEVADPYYASKEYQDWKEKYNAWAATDQGVAFTLATDTWYEKNYDPWARKVLRRWTQTVEEPWLKKRYPGWHGYLLVYDGETLVHKVDLPWSRDAHAGGMQTAGDTLVIGYQNDGVLFYDLSPLKQGKAPKFVALADLLPGFSVTDVSATIATYQGKKALILAEPYGGVAVARLPITSKTKLELLKPDYSGMRKTAYEPDSMAKLRDRKAWIRNNARKQLGQPANAYIDISNNALLTDQAGAVWLLQLGYTYDFDGSTVQKVFKQSNLDYGNAVTLYRLDISDNGTVKYVGPVREKALTTCDAYRLGVGSHFRFCGTAQVLDENSFALFSATNLPGNDSLSAISKSGKLVKVADFVHPPRQTVNVWLPGGANSNLASKAHTALAWCLRGGFRFTDPIVTWADALKK
jgi:hypothetical protein